MQMPNQPLVVVQSSVEIGRRRAEPPHRAAQSVPIRARRYRRRHRCPPQRRRRRRRNRLQKK